MKTKSTPVKHAAFAALLLGLSPALVAETSMEKRDKHQGQSAAKTSQSQMEQNSNQSMQSLRQAPEDPRGRQAGDLIGTGVYGSGGEQLGTLNDLIVDSQSGKIAYAVVASGGVLGIGSDLRAVPVSAVNHSGDRITLGLDQQRWEQAPVFTKEQLPSLGQDARGKEIHEFYGAKSDKSARQSGQFALVTEIRGKQVRANNQQQVGEIDDLIVRMESKTVAALLDANDEFAGTDQDFIVPLNKLQNFGQDTLSTRLTQQDFARATPSTDASWSANDDGYTGQPYVWPAYTGTRAGDAARRGGERVTDAAETTGDRLENAGDRIENRADRMANDNRGDRAPIEAVRRAVQSEVPGSSQSVNVVAERDKLVLRGTVPSQDVKERVEDRAENAAQGWDVESELRVASTNR